MKQILSIGLLSLFSIHAVAAEPEFHDVFTSKSEGYAQIRIPAVLVTKTGSVLAFAEGRQKPTDQAENDIVMKRSSDGGRTWSALRVLHDDGANSLNNPTVVQERETGRIFLWYQRIPAHLTEHILVLALRPGAQAQLGHLVERAEVELRHD